MCCVLQLYFTWYDKVIWKEVCSKCLPKMSHMFYINSFNVSQMCC